MDDLSDLLGHDVLLPDTEFSPYVEGQQIEGKITKVLKASKRYPAGRLELFLFVDGRRQTFLWDQSLFKREWVVPSTTTLTPRRKTATTPQKTPTRRNSSITLTPLAGPEGLSTPTLRSGSTPHSAIDLRSAPHSLATTPAAGPSRSAKTTPAKATDTSSPAKTAAATASAAIASAAAATAQSHTAHTPMPKLLILLNMVVLVSAALPAIFFAYRLKHVCSAAEKTMDISDTLSSFQADWRSALATVMQPNWWCALGFQYPIIAVNVVFFLNVDVGFWILSLLQGSTWLIDPYWTIIPPMIGLFYMTNPASVADVTRSAVSMALLFVWAARLTHSYFRREGYQLGAREDWRFTTLSAKIGRNWWWVSFFAAYLSQHLMLVGITLPLAAVHSSALPWHPIYDTLSAIAAVVGLALAFISDNQLRAFMLGNEKRVASGEAPVLILDTGLFRYSRHPNYFGEQLWWWGLSGFAVVVGQPWMIVGAAFNSLSLIAVTYMVEDRMMAKPERQALFKEYQQTTSAWVPWFKRKSRGGKKQE